MWEGTPGKEESPSAQAAWLCRLGTNPPQRRGAGEEASALHVYGLSLRTGRRSQRKKMTEKEKENLL